MRERLIFLEPALCNVLPGKACAGTVTQGAVWGPSLLALPSWVPLQSTGNTVGPRSHQWCWKAWGEAEEDHCLG